MRSRRRHPLIVAGIASSHLRRTGNALNSTPVYANGLVYIGCTDGYCYAFNAAR